MVESALADELRIYAAVLLRDADKHSDPDAIRLLASRAHETALRIEAGIGLDSLDDCTEVYADYPGDTAIFDLMDADDPACTHLGGHVPPVNGRDDLTCAHCGKALMPVYASREAE